MPSSYTQNGGIELIASGEQSTTWGITTDTNYDILDRLASGVGTITLSGTTHTLTTSDGSLSDGQYKVLVFAGSPSATNTVTLTPDDAQHVHIIRNTTSQSVVITQGSGGNATIAAGRTAVIYADGGGATAVVYDISNVFAASDITITGGTISGISALGVSGTLTATSFVGSGMLPVGGIVIWSGSVGSIPTGWFLCDGANGTPDLRNDFVIGAGGAYAVGATGGSNTITAVPAHTHTFSGTTDTQTNHTHTSNMGAAGSHTHSAGTSDPGNHTHGVGSTSASGNNGASWYGRDAGGAPGDMNWLSAGAHNHTINQNAAGSHNHTVNLTTDGAHTHTYSGTTGSTGNASVTITPPYYALCYIMRGS
jgi:hypothetical protein